MRSSQLIVRLKISIKNIGPMNELQWNLTIPSVYLVNSF